MIVNEILSDGSVRYFSDEGKFIIDKKTNYIYPEYNVKLEENPSPNISESDIFIKDRLTVHKEEEVSFGIPKFRRSI